MSKVYENFLYWLQEDYDRSKIISVDYSELEIRALSYAVESNEIDPFWENLCSKRLPNSVIVDGHHYTHYGMSTGPKYQLGMSGREFTIKMNDGRIIKTNNLWHQGKIPQNYRRRLPDNAEFVTVN